MFKRLFSAVLVGVLAGTLVGCGSKKTLKANNAKITNNKAEITVYLPEGQQLDNKYYKDKDIAINYLPNNKKSFSDKEVNQIVDTIDKHVKVVVITTKKSGLNNVFKKVKDKLPGVITVAGDIGEMHNGDLWKIKKNPSLDVAFQMDKRSRALVAAKMANIMGAKRFEYLFLSRNDKNPYINNDIKESEEFCKNNNIEFKAASVQSNNLSSLKKEIDDFARSNFSNTAVYTSDKSLTDEVLKYSLEKKYIIPYMNSDNDGEEIAKAIGLIKQYKEEPLEKFDRIVSEKLKNLGMKGKIAGVSEGTYSIPSELAIEIAKYMYEKNYMIEECYTDSSVVDRGNRNLKLSIQPKDMGISSGYVRNLVISPRIY